MAFRAFKKRAATVGLATIGAVALAMATPAAAFGAIPPPAPILVQGNASTCAQAGLSGTILFGAGGAVDATSAAGTGDVSADGKSIDVTINAGWTASGIVVKGGPRYNKYVGPFAGLITLDDLEPPLNNGGQHPVISHWFVCGEGDDEQDPPVTALLTSEVHLDGTHAFLDNDNPATAPANVHDSVVLTVTGLDEWDGDVIMFFFTNGTCDGDPADETEQGDIPVNEDTVMPLENLLPQSGLAAGDYSYQSLFVTGEQTLPAVTEGPCEPFKVVAEQTTTSPPGEHPPTGTSLTALIVTGVALVLGGTALVYFRRRRSILETPAE
jgi:LPXTG-motif cell wall-anchored protein